MERTLAIIKPDAVAARNTGRILQRIEEAGFHLRAMRMVHLSQREAEGFYAVHRERPIFASLTRFMSQGAVVVLALEAHENEVRSQCELDVTAEAECAALAVTGLGDNPRGFLVPATELEE